MIDPLLTFGLFLANVIALAITLSVLIVAWSQHPGDQLGRSVTQFLSVLAFYNFTVLASMAALLFQAPLPVEQAMNYLSVLGFGLCLSAAFSLLLSLAGKLRQAFHVFARLGFILVLLTQWPLWTGQLFEPSSSGHLMDTFAPAGYTITIAALVYITMAVAIAAYYARQLDLVLVLGLLVLLTGQALALLFPMMREFGVASLTSVVASLILGYRMSQMQLFNPLIMRTAQLAALRDISRTIISSADANKVLTVIAQQARRTLNADISLILVRENQEPGASTLMIAAQDGGNVSLQGRKLSFGEGISGRVFLLKQSLRLHNYGAWEGKSDVASDISLHAALSVPLLYDEVVVGVLTVAQLKAGRQFGERDQAMLEMLAPQAAVAIENVRLRERVAELEQSTLAHHEGS